MQWFDPNYEADLGTIFMIHGFLLIFLVQIPGFFLCWFPLGWIISFPALYYTFFVFGDDPGPLENYEGPLYLTE